MSSTKTMTRCLCSGSFTRLNSGRQGASDLYICSGHRQLKTAYVHRNTMIKLHANLR